MFDDDAGGVAIDETGRAVEVRQSRNDVGRLAHRRNEVAARRAKVAGAKSRHGESRAHQLDRRAPVARLGQRLRQRGKLLRGALHECRVFSELLETAPLTVQR